MRYLVVLEREESGWGAHVPDLPGCVAVAETREETIELIRDAIDFHLDGLKRAGGAIPKPSSDSLFVEISVA
jgi:predicted RNase H-like HicB family nuclease